MAQHLGAASPSSLPPDLVAVLKDIARGLPRREELVPWRQGSNRQELPGQGR